MARRSRILGLASARRSPKPRHLGKRLKLAAGRVVARTLRAAPGGCKQGPQIALAPFREALISRPDRKIKRRRKQTAREVTRASEVLTQNATDIRCYRRLFRTSRRHSYSVTRLARGYATGTRLRYSYLATRRGSERLWPSCEPPRKTPLLSPWLPWESEALLLSRPSWHLSVDFLKSPVWERKRIELSAVAFIAPQPYFVRRANSSDRGVRKGPI